MKTNNAVTDQWWTTLSSGEKELIRTLMRMVQGAKRSEVVEVARAARKWERGLSFFFKSRLKNQRTRRIYLHSAVPRTTSPAGDNRLTSYPSNERSQPDVSQGRH